MSAQHPIVESASRSMQARQALSETQVPMLVASAVGSRTLWCQMEYLERSALGKIAKSSRLWVVDERAFGRADCGDAGEQETADKIRTRQNKTVMLEQGDRQEQPI